MKKIFPSVLILLVAIFPFRYAFLSGAMPTASGILSMLLTILGVFIYLFMTITDGEKDKSKRNI